MKAMVAYTLAAILILSGAFGAGYFSGWESMVAQYSDLAAQVKAKNQLATEKLAELVRERDLKQAVIDRMALERESLDNEAKTEIARLGAELERRPVRVRVVTNARECGGKPETESPEGAGDSEGDAGPAYGVLPKENTRRLRKALSEIETLSAAYNSCRASYINQVGIAGD